jgi:precorrin-6B methylase 2
MEKDTWTADEILKMSGSYWNACTLHAGVKLDIFTMIGDEYLDAENMAGRLGGDLRGVNMLLNALAALGFLIKKEDKYANTPGSKTFLIKGSPKYIGYMIKHHHQLVPGWAQLAKAVTDGRPVRKRTDSEEERESFLMGMFNLANAIAPLFAKKIDLKDRHHLMDLGGGPGTYAIHFCLANPSLKATVYDLPTTRPFALKTIEQFGLSNRMDFMPGDYIEGDIKGSYDVAWLSHILHGEGPEECEKILKKSVSVLEPGGIILIHDFILSDTLDSPLFPVLFSLNMLVNTKEGQSYSESQIKGMLSKVGVKQIKRLPFQGPNDSGIICGVV